MDIFDVFRAILVWFFDWRHIWLMVVCATACVTSWYGVQQINGRRS